jgi:hypothetical protein
MNEDPYAERRKLTFEQAEGVAQLPRQLKLKEISPELRARLWGLIYDKMFDKKTKMFISPWGTIIRAHYLNRLHRMVDEYSPWKHLPYLKSTMIQGNYTAIFGLFEYMLRHARCPPDLPEALSLILLETRAAYRIINDDTIIPISSEAEFQTIAHAFVDLALSEFHGARHHLATAASLLTAGDYSASIRESVHTVESVARTLAPSGALSEALARLERSSGIHGGLKKGFGAIYGYSSDQQGIRHPLIDDPHARVDEADALFMIGACAAFTSYMINKARMAGLLAKDA